MTRRRWKDDGNWFKRINRSYNLNTFCLNWIEVTGIYDMPVVAPTQSVPEKLFPYDERNKWKPGAGAIQFYCTDNEFENVWLRASRYPHMPAVVQKAGCCLTPDFSVFTDFPLATQIWNVYRSRLLGALWQHLEIDVIPSVVWGTPDTFSWCFDGLPIGATLAVSTGHVAKHEHDGFLAGFQVLLERCQPSTVLVYGRGLKGVLEQMHPQIKRYDSRLTEIYYQKKASVAKARPALPVA